MFTLIFEGGIIVETRRVEQGHFPDGTLNLKLLDGNKELCIIEWRYENDAEMFTLMCIRNHFVNSYPDLVMPYCPHARMDRVKNPEDVFTLKYFANFINSLNFKSVQVQDAHSNVALALIDRVINITPKYDVEDALLRIDLDNHGDTNIVMFYPDEGAMKRYSSMFNKPYAFGMKKRNWETGKIEGLDIINADLVKSKDILIVDDICSKGGTFYHAAQALKDAGANRIYLFISHCEHSIFDGELIGSGLIEKVYTTDSIFKKEWTNDWIEIA